jgi:hypothetical protein
MNVIDMFEYETTSYRRKLKELYRHLDETSMDYDVPIEIRKEFFLKARGRFISVARLKRDMKLHGILDFFKIPLDKAPEIESGSYFLTDEQFFRTITFLGSAHEIPVFFEKLEKALIPGVKEARFNLGKTLKMFGISFADQDKE